MKNFEFSKFNCAFLIIMLKTDLILFVRAEGEIASIEKLINEYYTYVDEFKWKWMTPLMTCDRMRFNHHRTETHTPTGIIMLESQNCTKIKMRVLICIYKECLHTERHPPLETTKGVEFSVRGVNGEVYRVGPPYLSTQCGDPYTPVIKGCTYDGQDMRLDFSEIEELFWKNKEFVTSQTWENPQSTCELACPEFFEVDEIKIDRLHILLDSIECEDNCKQIQMNILKCSCQYKKSMKSKIVLCAQGILGEVYKVSPTYKGNTPEDFYIRKRIIDFEGKRVVPLCPNV